jgi:hypothetical protein
MRKDRAAQQRLFSGTERSNATSQCIWIQIFGTTEIVRHCHLEIVRQSQLDIVRHYQSEIVRQNVHFCVNRK